MPRASEHPGYKQRFPRKVTMEELEGSIFVVTSSEIMEGDEGRYAVCHGHLENDSEPLLLITGAKLIVPFLEDCIASDYFPVDCRFYKHGRTWMVD